MGLMNRAYTLILAFLLFPLLLAAQPKNPVKLGLRVAPSINWITTPTEGYQSDGIRGSANLGLITDFYFAKNYAISSGFSVLFPSGKMSYRDLIPYNDTVITGDVSAIYKFIYFEIPVMVKMSTNDFGKFSFFGQVGFGTGFRVKATSKADFVGDNGVTQTATPNISNKTHVMRESIIAGIGFEFHVDESTSLFAGVNYSNSLNNVFKSVNLLTNQEVKGLPNFAELSLGVLF
jgi:hypothetical protein